MADYLIPKMTLMEFQKLCEDEVKDLRSLVLVGVGGDYLATLIVPQTDFCKLQAEYLGEMSNSVKPRGTAFCEAEPPAEVVEVEEDATV